MRSGSHLVKYLLEQYYKAEWHPMPLPEEIDLDKINADTSKAGGYVLSTHYEYFQDFTISDLFKFNRIVEDRNIHVVYLDRKDINEQAMSRALACMCNWDFKTQDFSSKLYIEKSLLEKEYASIAYTRNNFSIDKMPITIHQEIYYEDILKNGLTINNEKIPWIDGVEKNPSKKDTIENYDSVIKWLAEFSEKYKRT